MEGWRQSGLAVSQKPHKRKKREKTHLTLTGLLVEGVGLLSYILLPGGYRLFPADNRISPSTWNQSVDLIECNSLSLLTLMSRRR